MYWKMGQIFNSSQEIEASAGFTNIRMFKLALMTSETAQDDLIKLDWDSWSDSTDASRLSDFSAVCYLFARKISQELGMQSKVQ